MSTAQPLGVGVIGLGYWGPKLVRNLAELPGVRLAAICDLSEERLSAVGQRHPNLWVTTDHRQLLADPEIDAVVIATPIRTHYRLAMAALLQGKHVLVEKPLTASSEEAERLVEASEVARRVLMVGHTFQYNPAVDQLRDLVQQGDLGHVYYIDAARLNLGLFQRDINVIWDLAPHDISILLHILGTRPLSVSAHGGAHVLEGVDDLAQLSLRFPGNVTAHVRLSWLDPCKVRRVTVVGSRKMAVFDDTAEQKLHVYDRRVALREMDGEGGLTFEYHDGDVVMPAVEPAEPLRREVEHFLTCIRDGGVPVSDGRIGAEVVRILEAVDTSRRQAGRWVDLGVPEHVDLPPAGAIAPSNLPKTRTTGAANGVLLPGGAI